MAIRLIPRFIFRSFLLMHLGLWEAACQMQRKYSTELLSSMAVYTKF